MVLKAIKLAGEASSKQTDESKLATLSLWPTCLYSKRPLKNTRNASRQAKSSPSFSWAARFRSAALPVAPEPAVAARPAVPFASQQ